MKIDLHAFVEQARSDAVPDAALLSMMRELHHAVQAEHAPAAPNAPAAAAPLDTAAVVETLAGLLSATVGYPVDALEADRSFADYGFNSISLMEFSQRIAVRFPLTLGPGVFLEHPSLSRLGRHLAGQLAALGPAHIAKAATAPVAPAIEAARGAGAALAPAAAAPRGAPAGMGGMDGEIAIIGMGGRLPKSADLDDFWRRLAAGESLITEAPADRWDWRSHFDDPAKPNKTDCIHGAFIDDVRGFDALHFNIAPTDAALIDPQHRLALQAVWETLEAAGYARDALRERKVGVYFGIERQDYADLIRARGIEIDGHLNTGNAAAMLVNRIAHFFDWRGPVSAVDAACASSFVALDEAVAALRGGRADAAVVGGVNLLLTPDTSIYNRKLGLFTGSGVVRPFDKAADGHMFSDGVGVLLLKRLADAERDHDTVLGVIKGISVRHGGKSMFLTAPNAAIHRETIAEALGQAGLAPDDIDYLEAQGTANPMADEVELRAFHEVFRARRGGKPKLGTVKGQLGHCSGASGVISLIKVLQSLRADRLIGIANLRELNWSDGEFACEPLLDTVAWPPASRDGRRVPRHVGVHNFGFGGVTGHLVLGEYLDAREPAPEPAVPGEQAILLSARSAPQLDEAIRRLRAFLAREDAASTPATLESIAYTLQTGREHWDHRVVVFADSPEALTRNLARCLDGEEDARAFVRRDAETGRDVRQLFSSEEMRATLRDWVDARSLRNLGRVWASGVKVDWAGLYQGRVPPRKAILPSYPFSRQPLWLPEAAPAAPAPAAARDPRSRFVSNVSTFAAQRYGSVFDGGERGFRRIDAGGARAFAEPAHLDMIDEALREAAEVRADEAVYLALRDIRHPLPLIVDGGAARVHTTLLPAADGEIAYRLASDAGSDAADEQVHALGHAALLMLDAVPHLDADTLASVDGVLDRADALLASAVVHGDGSDGDVAAAAALTAVWVSGVPGRALLPAAIASIGTANLYGAVSADSRIWARRAVGQPAGGAAPIDIDVFDARGQVAAELRDVVLAWPDRAGGELPSEAGSMPGETNGMIPTLNGTGAMTTRLLACSEAFVEFAAQARGEVMDMGCAYGVATLAALERGARVLAVDIDPRHLEILAARVPAALRERLSTQAGTLPGMTLPENHYAAIHAARVLHFLDPDAFRASLHRMASWLAPGGKLFVTCDSPYFPHWSARVDEYERLVAAGHPWPGHIADLAGYFRQRSDAGAGNAMDTGEHATDALGGAALINLVDPETLARECRLAGLEIEEAGFEGLALDDDEVAGSGGLEHASVIAVKPMR
ncbi:beta-ketoacyl synthase N-terminal-like domain-containing protein [Burkholderia alba]|uniref:beta-ketoacyl synthase N-terminal-like domain-containing protein n=1 Tax=Burkholderia alba TaxID=2683677 RepID=UPI002B051EAB|nr:beta-ketoacyl synthase N-terminal-like domain-containing protein [Burkholderia alba]